MARRLTLALLALAAIGSTAFAPAPEAIIDVEPQTDGASISDPFPLGACVMVRPVNDGRRICVIVNRPI